MVSYVTSGIAALASSASVASVHFGSTSILLLLRLPLALLQRFLLLSLVVPTQPSFPSTAATSSSSPLTTSDSTAHAHSKHPAPTSATLLNVISGAAVTAPSSFPRLHLITYYALNLLYFWLLATPVVSFILGTYLWLSVNYLGQHWNEAFSSLRVENFKVGVQQQLNFECFDRLSLDDFFIAFSLARLLASFFACSLYSSHTSFLGCCISYLAFWCTRLPPFPPRISCACTLPKKAI